ncbi:MAG: type II toxin-antitoxin system Phd/YefM family antitoxin [Parvibaculaceae bacterium]
MKQVGLFEAKTHLSRLIDLVEEGQEITITRHGKAVARLVPPIARPSDAQVEDMLCRLRPIRKRAALKKSEIKELIEEGRRY